MIKFCSSFNSKILLLEILELFQCNRNIKIFFNEILSNIYGQAIFLIIGIPTINNKRFLSQFKILKIEISDHKQYINMDTLNILK